MKRLLILFFLFAAPAMAQTHTFCATDTNCAMTGVNTSGNFNNILTVDGVKYASLASAFAACGTQCVIDMRGGLGSHVLGTFDPGQGTVVQLLLGPYADYTAVQITLRSGLQIIGSGTTINTPPTNGTTITSIGSNATPLFVIPQVNSQPAQNVYMTHLQLIGATGNTSQDAFFNDCSTTTNTGLWYSNFEDLYIHGFKGNGIHHRARPSDFLSTNQFNQWKNVFIKRVTGGAEAIRIEGSNSNERFFGGQFDGNSQSDGTDVFIGAYSAGSASATAIMFLGSTAQLANLAFQITGCWHCEFIAMHHEVLNAGYNITNGGAGNVGITIRDSYFATSGVNGGSGFLVSSSGGAGTVEGLFVDNTSVTTPDKFLISANGDNWIVEDTFPRGQAPFTSSGMTFQVNPAATLAIAHYKSILLNPSATAITTLNGMHATGELVTFRNNGAGTASFATGGNIDLGPLSTLSLNQFDTATFVREDLGSPALWLLVGTTAMPKLTLKKGSGAGNYTTASTTYVVPDSTNLCGTFTVPVGWKLSIQASGSIGTSTAIAVASAALTDNAACATANAGLLTEAQVDAGAVGGTAGFSLSWVIAGDGNAHNIALQVKTAAGADAVLLLNSSATALPTMVFTLMPSN